jgi:hypothetical protein
MIRKSNKFPKDKRKAVIDWILQSTDRGGQRRALAEKWLEEDPYTDYRYYVETCDDGKRVYLLRPTWLNKGFDFQVNLEGFSSELRNKSSEMPSHGDVISDLKKKVASYPKLSEELFAAISDIYDCVEPKNALLKHPEIKKIKAGLPVDTILRIIKWLFIEQDLTYWLYTGRNMLMSAIEVQVFNLKVELKEK